VHRYSRRLWAALWAEFLGMAIFQIYGGSANDEVAAFGNGLTLAVVSESLTSEVPSAPHRIIVHMPLYGPLLSGSSCLCLHTSDVADREM
jgi:hypothetical protein